MEATLQEWLNLALRWAHVIAGIMWIGDSFLFMWLDRHLEASARPREGDVHGELWMAHGGGFYELVKRRSLRPEELPARLYSFKWESYSTWITGFFLLSVVYYFGGQAILAEPGGPLGHPAAVALSFSLLFAAVGVYDLLCRTPLLNRPALLAVVGLVLLVAVAWGLSFVFTQRAVFLQVGAMVATVMSSNVLLRIIPAQKHMLAATRAGTQVDTSFGARAKKHSTHNHYLTLPVVFLMLSNHFPALYAGRWPWLVLGLMAAVGVGVKVFMNQRLRMPKVQLGGTAVALGAVVFLTLPTPVPVDPSLAAMPKVSFASVSSIVEARCVSCHATRPSNPAFAAPPNGIVFERPEHLAALKERILARVFTTRTMPLGNVTGMTDAERTTVAAWVAQGGDLSKTAEDEAQVLFQQRCVICHGAGGNGDGPAAASLQPPPRKLSDAAWQKSVTDEELRKVIVGGGGAVGKSPVMPANPDLQTQPQLVDGLVKVIRSFGAGDRR